MIAVSCRNVGSGPGFRPETVIMGGGGAAARPSDNAISCWAGGGSAGRVRAATRLRAARAADRPRAAWLCRRAASDGVVAVGPVRWGRAAGGRGGVGLAKLAAL
ncbi:hypothetical protein Cci01nite_68710 [Catellatospora citrea]|uniref:Uncharacterized protein n=1 Tax=Catellatospora citrea TaxID=53366 RepID=A0A8J3KF31_9ACTN|nr:hypothetical protein Cci01nite_68710 [Catellatospora citrea]